MFSGNSKMDDHLKSVVDGVSVLGVVATLAGYLPAIAALLSIIWTLIRIYETETFKRFKVWFLELLGWA